MLAGAEAVALLKRFPARPRLTSWPETAATRDEVIARLGQPPLRVKGRPSTQDSRMVGVRILLSWLETFPGDTWQQRWEASPIAAEPEQWYEKVREWTPRVDRATKTGHLQAGLLALLCADVVRPDTTWLAVNYSRHLRPALAQSRDPEGFASLEAWIPQNVRVTRHASEALAGLAQVLATRGGKLQDIVVGDLLERCYAPVAYNRTTRGVRLAYLWLRERGQFPHDAPTTLLFTTHRAGQVTPAELVDRYDLKCQPVRDLLVGYLTERQPTLDYATLKSLAAILAGNFWADLEQHHPGIDSIRLSPETATAWKTRLATKTARRRQADGTVITVTEPRTSAPAIKMTVRAFYLDIGEWALSEPERWGQWASPPPVTEAECSVKKLEKQQKSKSDRRTRERLPVLPALVRLAIRRLKEATARLDALNAAPLGSTFTVLGETFTVPKTSVRPDGHPTGVRDAAGERRDLGAEERRAFWAWAAIEIFRHTGIRIEELQELSHHSIISYRLPSGDVVPLLQIAPSKTDQERLILISPELADVLSAVISRVRDSTGRVPLIPSYDLHEKTWNSPMPLLFQWSISHERRPVSGSMIRKALDETLRASGITDSSGNPLLFQPHDFRRMFITEAIMNGLPPHIAQVIAGHRNINTTMGYAAIYPTDALEAHRAFIARRRDLRPAEEYRAVTAEEWQEFLSHFERRKLALGDCGRAYGTDCIHEHACVRCPVLIVAPDEKPRLGEIRDNLKDRIAEAEREGWLGEVEGLSTSLAAAEDKIAQIEAQQEKKQSPVFLGLPNLTQLTARTSEATR
ncbi:tyrosine-type recombinase/integrase [Streptomyces sp. NPDC002287]